MKPKFPHRRTISLILQKLALRNLMSLSATLSRLRRIDLFRSLVMLANSRRDAGRSTHKLEYQFSASSTPLIHRYYYKRSRKHEGLQGFIALLCPCIYLNVGSLRWDDEDLSADFVSEPARMLMLTGHEDDQEDNAARLIEPCGYQGGFDDCVDEKAEKFIAKFYEEMRRQKRESSGSSQCCEDVISQNVFINDIDRSDGIVFYPALPDCEDVLAPFTEESLGETKPNSKPPQITPAAQECVTKLSSEFRSKMSDDMQTPPILTSTILDTLRFINSSLTMLRKKQQKRQQLSMVKSLSESKREIKKVLVVHGLLLSFSEVLQQLKEKALKRTEEDISKLIEDRTLARKIKDFALSDKIRSDLTTKGISLIDLGNETIWRPCVPTSLDSVTS